MGETYVPVQVAHLGLWHSILRRTFGDAFAMLNFGTDFEGWYKQHAIRPDQFLLLVLVFFNPHTRTIEFAFSVAEPFGGRAAPLCCGRVLRLLTFSAARLFGIAAADYVDDVNAVEPSQIAPLGLVCWKQFVGEICGFRLESSKEFIGNKGTVQGLQCDVSTSEFVTSLSKARALSLTQLIDSAQRSAELPPFAARKLANKLASANGAMFGKIGRAISKPLYLRAHSSVFRANITTALDKSLTWWKRTLSCLQQPRLTPSSPRPFCVSFSDGEATPIVGAALWYRDAAGDLKCKKTRCLAPRTVPGLWSNDTANADHINAVEALGPLLLLCTFNEILRGSLWVHYIDNGGALGCIVNGHSDGSKIGHSMSSMAAEFWHRAAHD